jgi:hypothetical protein
MSSFLLRTVHTGLRSSRAVDARGHGLEIGEQKIVAQAGKICGRVDAVTVRRDRFILEVAYDSDHRVAQANLRQMFAVALLAGIVMARNAGKVDALDGRLGSFLGLVQLGEISEPLVGHLDDRSVLLERLGRIDRLIGDRRKQGALAGQRWANQSNLHDSLLAASPDRAPAVHCVR